MRTGRSLTVCRSLLPGGVCSREVCSGGGVCSWKGVCFRGLSVPRGGLLQGGSAPGGVCSLGCLLLGGVCSRGVSALGGSAPGACLLPGGVCSWGVSALGVVCSWGVSAPGGCLLPVGGLLLGGVGIPACTETDTPPVYRITDACKNITLAQFCCRNISRQSSNQANTYLFFDILR